MTQMSKKKEDRTLSLFGPLESSNLEPDVDDLAKRKKAHKLKIHHWIKLGALASKFGIDQMDEFSMRGAFAEIQSKAMGVDVKREWKQLGLKLFEEEWEAKHK